MTNVFTFQMHNQQYYLIIYAFKETLLSHIVAFVLPSFLRIGRILFPFTLFQIRVIYHTEKNIMEIHT